MNLPKHLRISATFIARGIRKVQGVAKWIVLVSLGILSITILALLIGFILSPQDRQVAKLRYGNNDAISLPIDLILKDDITKLTRKDGYGLDVSIAELSAISADVYGGYKCRSKAEDETLGFRATHEK